MLSLLEQLEVASGISKGVKIEPAAGPGNHYDPELIKRTREIMVWLVRWSVPLDQVRNAFLVNGIAYANDTYLLRVYKSIRQDLGISKRPKRFYRTKHILEVAKLGASFDYLYYLYYDQDKKMNTNRRFNLKNLLGERGVPV